MSPETIVCLRMLIVPTVAVFLAGLILFSFDYYHVKKLLSSKMPYMTANCPFCGDKRPAEHVVDKIPSELTELHHYECVCCGAEGPCANDQASALRRWNFRGIDSAIWLSIANRPNGGL